MESLDHRKRRNYRDVDGTKSPRPLHEMLPQAVPYAMHIDPTNACNFKCPFCPTGNPAALRRVGRPTGRMPFELYEKAIRDLRDLTRRGGAKVQRLHLYKDGEPLLHKQLPDMVRLAKRTQVARSVEVTTNGSLLTAPLMHGLVAAGLDVLRVSVEHVQDSVYERISGGRVRYRDIRANLQAAHDVKNRSGGSTHLHVKIIDFGLSEQDKATFVEDLAPCSDSWDIVPVLGSSRTDVMDCSMGRETVMGLHGVPQRDRLVCPEPFAKLAINFDGSTSVCCADWSHGTVVGNVVRDSVGEIWTGRRLASFRLCHLLGNRATIPACRSCGLIRSFAPFADLDDQRERLLKIFAGVGIRDLTPAPRGFPGCLPELAAS